MERSLTPPPVRTSRRQPSLLPAVACALFIAAGGLLNLANPALSERHEGEIWDGSWAEAFQRGFDRSSPLLVASRTTWGVLDYALFRQGRPGVLVGREGWLYSSEEFDLVDDPAAAVASWAETVAGVGEALAARHIDLIVALVPSKAAMVAAPAPTPLPDGVLRRYDAALAALAERGVIAPDLRPALLAAHASEPVYLRTDTHWTPHGASVAAEVLAQTIRERTDVPAGSASFVTEVVGYESLFGDLTSFLDLGPFLGSLGPAPDRLELRRTVDRAGPGGDLFAEVDLPVTLVGTSYSADPRWNMAGALRDALDLDLHDASLTGVGALTPMQRYLASEALVSTPPRVVVWEIPARYLTLTGFVPEEGAALILPGSLGARAPGGGP
jgi:alginate O-acetyltransferase complex protein AlgJ